MTAAIVFVFIVGYVLVALENVTRISKTDVSLLMAVLCWALFYMGFGVSAENVSAFTQTLGETSEILFFLLGAMVIVEVVDTKKALLWKLAFMTFFLSAVQDNMTTAIVMIMVLNKLTGDGRDKLIYSSIVILAANSGGAFSPIGDVTTIMLWVKGHISTFGVLNSLFVPSLLAYCAGIGGSMLIIGSAAGVVVMDLQNISFGWYLKHFSWIACLGYLSGILAFWLQGLL